MDKANDNVTKFSENTIGKIEEFASALERYVYYGDVIDECADFVKGE